MNQFLSTTVFVGALAGALWIIIAMLRDNMIAIRHALAGRSLRAEALRHAAMLDYDQAGFAPRHVRQGATPRRIMRMRAAA